jgi:hypothetical protein
VYPDGRPPLLDPRHIPRAWTTGPEGLKRGRGSLPLSLEGQPIIPSTSVGSSRRCGYACLNWCSSPDPLAWSMAAGISFTRLPSPCGTTLGSMTQPGANRAEPLDRLRAQLAQCEGMDTLLGHIFQVRLEPPGIVTHIHVARPPPHRCHQVRWLAPLPVCYVCGAASSRCAAARESKGRDVARMWVRIRRASSR